MRNPSFPECGSVPRSRIPHAWARARFDAIAIWITLELRFDERMLEFR